MRQTQHTFVEPPEKAIRGDRLAEKRKCKEQLTH